MEKILVLQPDNRLAVVETVTKGQTAIFNPNVLIDYVARAVEHWSPMKVEALALERDLKPIDSTETLAAAKFAEGKLAGVRIDADKDREIFTKPFLFAHRLVNEQYGLLIDGIKKTESRIKTKVQAYAQEVERVRQSQLAEQRKRDEAAAEAIRKAQQEADRLAAEAARLATPEAEEAAEDAAFAAELAEVTQPAPVAIAAPVGKPVLDFELEHAGTRHELQDILAFAKLYPHFCKIEIWRSAVIEELNNGGCFGAKDGVIPCVPGLRIFEKFKTHTRAVR